jgi:hypothetical protein
MDLLLRDVAENSEGCWIAKLRPSEVRQRLGQSRSMQGARSVVGVLNADYHNGQLAFPLNRAVVLNIGTSDETIFVDLASGPQAAGSVPRNIEQQPIESNPLGSDAMFLSECRSLLDASLASIAERLMRSIRDEHPGELREGQARKWVNFPENFLAITIQPRDQSLAVHVKGNPTDFAAPTLEIRTDRPSYSRFKLQRESQLRDALRTILSSAQRTQGR